MKITAKIWDKASSINGRDAGFLTEHFKKANGNDDRVLIEYDGVINRIEYIDDCFFTTAEKVYMNELVNSGINREQAISDTWAKKIQEEVDKQEFQIKVEGNKIEQLKSDIDYIAIMTGVEL